MNNERDGCQENDKYIPKHAYSGDINNFDRNNTYNSDCYKVKNDIVLDENIYSDFDDNRDENIKVKSVKKKYKSANFAAGCSREVIERGAELLGWTLEDLIDRTIKALRTFRP